MRLNYATLAIVVLVMAIMIRASWSEPWTMEKTAGILIAIPSALLLVVARIQLGSAFSVKAKATTLVTTGLYARIRNPIYVFGGLAFAGFILWSNRPWLLLVFAIVLPMQIIRMHKEEKVLTERFGEEYLAYKKKTWF